MADTGSCLCFVKIKVNHLKFCIFFSTRCHWRSNIRFKDFLNWTECFSMRNFSLFLSLGYLLNPCIRNIRHHGGPLQSNIWSHQFSFFTHQSFLFPGILTIRGDSSVFDTDSSQTTQFLQPDVMTAGVGAERQVCQKPWRGVGNIDKGSEVCERLADCPWCAIN